MQRIACSLGHNHLAGKSEHNRSSIALQVLSLTQTKQADYGNCQGVLKEQFWHGALIPFLVFSDPTFICNQPSTEVNQSLRLMIKNLTFLFFFICSATTAFSQNVDFPENNVIWKEAQTTIAGPITQHLALCGDTLLNGKLYSQITHLQVDDSLQITSSEYIGALRQENGLVYFHADFSPDDILLYDFSLEAGEEVTLSLTFVNQQVTRKVDSTDVQLLAGKMRKVIYFENSVPNCSFLPEMWIEGIGSSYGLLGRAFEPCMIADAGSQLLCFEQEDEYLNLTLIECFLPTINNCSSINATGDVLNKNSLLYIFPNPAASHIFIEINSELINADFKLSVINSFGQIIKPEIINNGDNYEMDVAHLPVGIYFIKIMDRENRQVDFGKFIKI